MNIIEVGKNVLGVINQMVASIRKAKTKGDLERAARSAEGVFVRLMRAADSLPQGLQADALNKGIGELEYAISGARSVQSDADIEKSKLALMARLNAAAKLIAGSARASAALGRANLFEASATGGAKPAVSSVSVEATVNYLNGLMRGKIDASTFQNAPSRLDEFRREIQRGVNLAPRLDRSTVTALILLAQQLAVVRDTILANRPEANIKRQLQIALRIAERIR